MSNNDSRKEFYDSHVEFISNSGNSPIISTYEAETSHDSTKEFNDAQQELRIRSTALV